MFGVFFYIIVEGIRNEVKSLDFVHRLAPVTHDLLRVTYKSMPVEN